MKPAASLWDLAGGAQPPTDVEMKAQDAPILDAQRLADITESIDTLCQRLRFLRHESRLTATRHLAKGVNSTTRMFNVAVFVRDKEETGETLFDHPSSSVELESV